MAEGKELSIELLERLGRLSDCAPRISPRARSHEQVLKLSILTKLRAFPGRKGNSP